ncbi:hypothetical protein PPH41_29955, partial [Burkholderia gladioli]|nr:hypothetical protein [Burkholderia gladioli]
MSRAYTSLAQRGFVVPTRLKAAAYESASTVGARAKAWRVSGWQMLNAPDVPGGDAAVKPIDPRNVMARAFFPLTIPLTVGPGSIAT